jgi:putative heme-binding domain-containing protein
MSALKSRLGPTVLAHADLPRGRATFNRVCGSCHKLYGEGGDIGPDLTGSGRNNLDYLLENIVDPSAVVTVDFRLAVIAMKDGRILNGIVKRQSEKSLTLQTQTEAIVIERSDIESLRPSPSSLMPDGLLDTLSADEIRDLIAYLAHQTQVPLDADGAGAQSLGKSR